MPFRGSRTVNRKFSSLVRRIRGPLTERAVTEILITAASNAAVITPVDTGNLINSQFRFVSRIVGGARGRLFYTAKYAQFVHDAPDDTKFKKANAENEFLVKGFERDGAEQIRNIIINGYKL